MLIFKFRISKKFPTNIILHAQPSRGYQQYQQNQKNICREFQVPQSFLFYE